MFVPSSPPLVSTPTNNHQNFDPKYTPNHDDHLLRYSYKNQPTIIWWNLVRLAEDTAELFGASNPDDPTFIESGVQTQEEGEALVKRAEAIIESVGEEYKSTFLTEYKRIMSLKLGLQGVQEKDMDELFTPLLELLEEVELDYHHFFRRLSGAGVFRTLNTGSEEDKTKVADAFLQKDGSHGGLSRSDAQKKILAWLELYTTRIRNETPQQDEQERIRKMKSVNPNFVPRNWVLDEIIRRVEKNGEREVLQRVMEMVQRPFDDSWDTDEDGGRWVGDVPVMSRATQCSCSS